MIPVQFVYYFIIVMLQKCLLLSGLRIKFLLPEVLFLAYPKTSRKPVLYAFIKTLGKPDMGLLTKKN